jgi:hypothetical protein
MAFRRATSQPARLSDASYCQSQVAQCEKLAEHVRSPDVKALYKDLARYWLELARKVEARNQLHR